MKSWETCSLLALLLYSLFLGAGEGQVHILRNNQGWEAHILPVGAVIQKLRIPDRNGKLDDIVLGYDDEEQYLAAENPYFGAVVGRCANRIAGAKFELDGEEYNLSKNDGKNSLHGGKNGWNKKVWTVKPMKHPNGAAVKLTLVSESGDEGYPGTVTAKVMYFLTDSGDLITTMEATSDAPTIINMAQHSYFNLNGHSDGASTILDHILLINGSYYTPVDDEKIPTGKVLPVKGTPFDFSQPTTIGSHIREVEAPEPGGYDHNYILFGMNGKQAKERTKAGSASTKAQLAVRVFCPKSGRAMDLFTNAPGLQFYSGNYLDGSLEGKGGVRYPKHGGFALETQGFPDAINQPSFPSVVIRPGEQYRHLHVWRFYQYGGESGVRKRGLGRKPVSKVKGPLKRGVGGVKESKRYRPRLDSFESD